MIPYDQPPRDQERRVPLHFIRTEVAARAGALITGGSTGLAFVDGISPYLKFAALVISVLLGGATLTYYCLAIAEKWRILRKAKRDEE